MSNTLQFNQRVKTPSGPGVVKGWWIDKTPPGAIAIIVAHRPDQVSDDVLAATFFQGIGYRGGPLVLAKYPLDDVEAI